MAFPVTWDRSTDTCAGLPGWVHVDHATPTLVFTTVSVRRLESESHVRQESRLHGWGIQLWDLAFNPQRIDQYMAQMVPTNGECKFDNLLRRERPTHVR